MALAKFGAASQQLYLSMLRKTGQQSLACQAVEVSPKIVNDQRKYDPEFARAEEAALALRSAEIVERLEREAIEGTLEPLYDKKGHAIMVEGENGKMVPAYRRKLETPLRKMVLARYDSAYRETIDHMHTHKGGVLVMPMPAQSIGEWEELAQSSKPKELGE